MNHDTQQEVLDSKEENQRRVAVRGFSQTFGLHPYVAATTLTVDLMLNAATFVTFGAFEIASLLAAVPIGLIAFLAQKKFYGDDSEAALIKALIVSLLTAIPAPISPIVYLPSGLIGLLRMSKR